MCLSKSRIAYRNNTGGKDSSYGIKRTVLTVLENTGNVQTAFVDHTRNGVNATQKTFCPASFTPFLV